MSIVEDILVLILNVVRRSVSDCFFAYMDKAKSSFNMERGYEDVEGAFFWGGGGVAGVLCVCARL